MIRLPIPWVILSLAVLVTDRLTAVEQQNGDLKRGLEDGHKRLGDLEAAYWGQRESDQRQRDEQTKIITEQAGSLRAADRRLLSGSL